MKKLENEALILKNILNRHNFWPDNYTLCHEDLERFRLILKKIGYAFYPSKASSCDGIFINHKKNLVIKLGFFLSNFNSRNKIPTKFVRNKGGYPIVIQPKASLKNRWKAFEILESKGSYGEDFHDDNVGWYNGKPVHIDW